MHGAPVRPPTGVEAYIEFIRPQLDVDGNGVVTAFSDGLMILKVITRIVRARTSSAETSSARELHAVHALTESGLHRRI